MGLMEEYEEDDVKGGLRIMEEQRQATMSSTHWKDLTYNKEPANKLQPWQQKRKGSSRVESRSSGDIEDENWSMVGWPRRRQ